MIKQRSEAGSTAALPRLVTAYLRQGKGMALTLGAALAVAASAHCGAEQTPGGAAPMSDGVSLVMLGAAAGRTSWGGSAQGGTSAAVVVGDDRYLVDFGRGWQERYYEAGLGTAQARGGFSGLETLKAAFVTHLHSDHIVDLPRLLLFGATEGLRRRQEPVIIIGPGSRGELVPINPSLDPASIEMVSPDAPMPGTEALVERLYAAYASDLNDNIRDSGMPNPRRYIEAHDIELPTGLPSPNQDVSPPMAPFDVYSDDNVRVSAILVHHPPIYPSFAYRFDTDKGSIVFSGDTRIDDNLLTLAQGADVLVLEAMSREWTESLFPEPRSAAQIAKLDHLLKSHVLASEAGEFAQRAGVGTLVLAHLGPGNQDAETWRSLVDGFDGEVHIGMPLTQLALDDRGGSNR